MGYKILSSFTDFEGNKKVAGVRMEKTSLSFLLKKTKANMFHKVYFDLYDLGSNYIILTGYCTIDKDWIDLGYTARNKVKNLISKHFSSEYVVGNYRNTIQKL